MRLSQAYIPTRKEIPSDAVIPSHRLMLRAGLIHLLSSGVYSYLPLGWKVMKKVMNIIREEMNSIGAQELQLPALNPIEIWDETGRNTDFGDEMFRLKDRKNRSLVLAPTHEEVICDLARKFIHSYKNMPQIWYQIQTKFRDEPRPRSGVIRARQFIMKDSYSMDIDEKRLETSYQLHANAYKNIFRRCGLKFHIVSASSGLMGGSGSQEYMIESEYGEDKLTICTQCEYAANLEVAISIPKSIEEKEATLKKIHTPEKKTIEEVTMFLGKTANTFIKSLVYVYDDKPIIILIRGDHELNESKLQLYICTPHFRPANEKEVQMICGTETGFIGPVGLKKPVRIVADFSIQNQHNLTTGANEKDYHLTGIEMNRDIRHNVEYADLKTVVSGEKCSICNGNLKIVNAIELGHIFKLGTKYSESMRAYYQNQNGNEKAIVMGSYGIGVERIIAASIEQNCDEKGIVWTKTLSPYMVHIIPINWDNKNISKLAITLYKELHENKIETLIDDRNLSPGYKFKDADLLGIPLQVIIGEKWLKEGMIEIKNRQSNEKIFVCQEEIEENIIQLQSNLK